MTESVALARALTECPGVTPRSAIAVLGAAAPSHQVALAHRGFTRVTAVVPRGAAMLRERYGCLCVTDLDADQTLGAAALAALRRRLEPMGTIVLDVSANPLRAVPAERLRATGFAMLQYRVLHLEQSDGTRRRAVFLLARALLRAVRADSRFAARGLGAIEQRAA